MGYLSKVIKLAKNAISQTQVYQALKRLKYITKQKGTLHLKKND